ncbi:MAG: hypothetical protein HY903_11560 [Deltaproteobacteria bacterium]|nr:hypothetical protein [Deltaproteobacteria bacterium]
MGRWRIMGFRDLILSAALVAGCSDLPEAVPPAPSPAVFEERVSPTTTFIHREDGSTTAVITAAPRAFRDPSGAWRPIETALARTGEGAIAQKSLVRARFPAELGTGSAVRFESQQGLGLSWRPSWPEAGSAALGAEGALAWYDLDGATERFRVLKDGVKHDLVLASAEAVRRYLTPAPDQTLAARATVALDPLLSLAARGQTAAPSFVTSGAIELVGPHGTELVLPAPRAYDARGASVAARYRFESASGALAVEVPAAWLLAPERSFPLVVDPPATVTTGFALTTGAAAAAGPGSFSIFPDGLRLGSKHFTNPVADEYYQLAFRFDLTALDPASVVSAVSANVFFRSTNRSTANSQTVHFGRLTRDPETATSALMWQDGAHGANPDYAVVAGQQNDCDCWMNGGDPVTQTGTPLNAAALADLQAAIASGSFLIGMHVPSYATDTNATPDGVVDRNEPELYVDFVGAPSVISIWPDSGSSSAPQTVTVLGTSFLGQTGTTAVLRPIPSGADTAASVTYVSASRIRVAVPVGLAPGVYDVVVGTVHGSSIVTVADRYTSLGPTKTWNGSVSTAWSEAGNWTPPGAPDATNDAVIPALVATVDVAGAAAHAVTVTGGTLATNGRSVAVGGDLTVSAGTVDMTAGGTVLLSGSLFLAATASLSPGTGRVDFASQTPGRRAFMATGVVFADDFERGTTAWTASVTSGSPIPWRVEEKVTDSPIHAWFQQGQRTVAGAAALASPSFSLAGKASATLRWRHRYRISLENGSGPGASDGFVVQVSINGGASWTSIAPHAASTSPFAAKFTSGTCANGTARTANPVAAGPSGLFAGELEAWTEGSVSLTPYAGRPDVKVRFWSGWDNCNDQPPHEGLYVDDVIVTADAAPLAFADLVLSGAAEVLAVAPLSVSGNLDLQTAASELDLNGGGLTCTGGVNNAGRLVRGPAGTFAVTGPFVSSGTFLMGTGDVSTGLLENAGAFVGGTGNLTAAGISTSGTLATGDGATVVNGDLLVTGGSATMRGPTLSVTGSVRNDGTLEMGNAALTLSSAAPASLGGSGTFRQSAAGETLLYDGFEANAVGAAPSGWTTGAPCGPSDVLVDRVPTSPGVGTRVVNLGRGNTCKTNTLTRAVSTTGRRGIRLAFGRATNTQAGETYVLYVKYSLDGGQTFKTAKTVTGTSAYTADAVYLSDVDPAVDDNADLQIQLEAFRNFTGSYHYVDEIRLTAGTAGLGAVTATKTAAGVVTVDPTDLAGELTVAGALTLSQGTLRVAAGKTLALSSPAATTSTTAASTTLDVEPGAALRLSGNTTLSVAGRLELVGTAAALRARVTTTDPVTPERFALAVSGTFQGDWFEIAYADARGLDLAPGASIVALDRGRFHHPPAGGALLSLRTAGAPPGGLATGCEFEDVDGVAGAVNVDGSFAATAVRFDAADGAFQGEEVDRDFGGATPGNVTWTYPATEVQVVAAAEAQPGTANSAGVTIQVTGAGGVPTTSHARYAAAVSAGGSASVAGAPITIPPGASATTITVTDTVAEDVTVTLTETSSTSLAEVPGTVSFIAGPATRLTVAGFPSPTVAGEVHDLEVTVRDDWDNVATSHVGAIRFTSSDPAAGLPADTPFTLADNGAKLFQLAFATAGTQFVTATCTTLGTISGTQAGIVVVPPPCVPAGPDDTCNGVDEDCDGPADEHYLPIATSCGVGACAATGVTACAGGAVLDSCAPGSPAGPDGSCNGVDDDCDGPADEHYLPVATSCGVGGCAATGVTACAGGTVVDSCSPGSPRAPDDRTCDGLDDDCDGFFDEDVDLVSSCPASADACARVVCGRRAGSARRAGCRSAAWRTRIA